MDRSARRLRFRGFEGDRGCPGNVEEAAVGRGLTFVLGGSIKNALRCMIRHYLDRNEAMELFEHLDGQGGLVVR